MKTKKGNLATDTQATPSNQKTSTNKRKKRGKLGFSLVELVVIIAMMAVLTAILVPSLLPYVERSRAQRDDSAMSEVTNAILLAIADSDVYDELADASLPENVSCYIDSQYEADHEDLISKQSIRTGAYNQYIFDDQARTLDATKYFAAGNMHGVTITFKPIAKANKTKYVLADGIINQFISNKAQKLSEFPYLYGYVRQTVGEELELASRTYRNSEYTIFIKIGTTGARQADAQDAIMAYGQFSGTNLSTSETRYYNAYGRAVSNPEIGTEIGYIPDNPSDPEPTDPIVNPIDDDIPVISNGREQVFDKASPSDLIFTSTAPFNTFQAVKIDGTTIGAGNYAVSEGSTIVTLFASYISTLPTGTHSIAIVSDGGVAGTTFTIINSNYVVVMCGHGSTKVINNRAATCVMNGYTGDTYCADCDVLIANGDYVAPTGHREGEKVKENNVEPTCYSKGSYSMATYCESCGIELNREHFTVIETTHQGATRNENIVDATCSTIGSYEVVTYCRFCNVEMNREYRTIATTEHIATNKTENVIASTCYSEGSYDLVTYCSVCNSELNRANKPIQKANHTHATRVENETQSTCSVNGSYDTVIYCEVCGYEINRTKHTVALLDHTQATKTDNAVAVTCTVDGSYDTVTYCKVCNIEIDRKTTVVPKTGHVEKTTTENNILATCLNAGSYDTVVYCVVCNDELSRTTQSVPKLSHTTATKKENEIAATCSKEGSYETVTYCTVCNEEIGRQKQTTQKLAHTEDTKTENNVAATCSKEGSYETVTYCKVCNVEISRVTNSVAKLAHTQATKTEANVAPTCTKDGSNYLITYCTVCKVEISRTTQVVAKTGHLSTVIRNATEIYSGDTYCTTCNELVAAGTYNIAVKASLNDYSWLEIQCLAKMDVDLKDYNIKIGDTKTDGTYTYVLVDDARDTHYGGLVFMFNASVGGDGTITKTRAMNSTMINDGGFAASNMVDYLNNTGRSDAIVQTLSSDLLNVIKSVDVRCNDGPANPQKTWTAEGLKLFLPSVREVGFETLSSAGWRDLETDDGFLNKECILEGETYDYNKAVFDWFNSKVVSDVEANRSNISKNFNNKNSELSWWLRSAYGSYNKYFWNVDSDGDLSCTSANYAHVVVPAFVVG